MENKRQFPSSQPAVVIHPNKNDSGNGVTRPTKKIKLEPQQPIPAIPLAAVYFPSLVEKQLYSTMVVQKPAPPFLPPKIQVTPAAAVETETETETEYDTDKFQKDPGADRVVPPSTVHKKFWKAGEDFPGAASPCINREWYAGGPDHIRVHPRFLHSNATSHKWALGAFAELLDNSLDEIRNGATFVNIDIMKNKKNGDRMLVIEDNGGGMDPIKMRQCMSLGYSGKRNMANTIGQYGNGFKTSSMRLGADVIVFSRSEGGGNKCCTQSIGLLSYTFLRCTQKEDIEVPMLDYERKEQGWERISRPNSSATATATDDWNSKVDTIVQWSPFLSESDLLDQFNHIKEDHGTRIFIYNLWEDDEGELELDFDTDPNDIQIRGANRDEKNIEIAKQFPNSRPFLTYRHSLRSYASILYLRIPPGFKMILRGKQVPHHNTVNDMMMSQKVVYRPQQSPDGPPRDSNMFAEVTIGFVKDAKSHIDVQGFNVYHKNRLIKPFWRVWHAAGSDGRGVIGVLEANFVEPAHDKQGFERTLILSRLENKLVDMQKNYWSTHCHEIGYAPRRMKKFNAEKTTAQNVPIPVSLPPRTQTGVTQNSNAESSRKANNTGQLQNKKENHNGLITTTATAINNSNPDNKGLCKRLDPSNTKTTPVEEEEEGKNARPKPVKITSSKHTDDGTKHVAKLAKENGNLKDISTMAKPDDLLRVIEEEKKKSKLLETELDEAKEQSKSLKTELDEARMEILQLNKECNRLTEMLLEERKSHKQGACVLHTSVFG